MSWRDISSFPSWTCCPCNLTVARWKAMDGWLLKLIQIALMVGMKRYMDIAKHPRLDGSFLSPCNSSGRYLWFLKFVDLTDATEYIFSILSVSIYYYIIIVISWKFPKQTRKKETFLSKDTTLLLPLHASKTPSPTPLQTKCKALPDLCLNTTSFQWKWWKRHSNGTQCQVWPDGANLFTVKIGSGDRCPTRSNTWRTCRSKYQNSKIRFAQLVVRGNCAGLLMWEALQDEASTVKHTERKKR